MTTGIRRFILRFIVGLLTFLLGVAAAMAFAGFRPFDSGLGLLENNHSEQHYRHYYHSERSCKFKFRDMDVPPPPPPAPLAPPAESKAGTVYLKGHDGITVIVEK